MLCNICEHEMEHINEFWKCPVCGTELWTDEEKLREYQREQKRKEQAEQDRKRMLWSVGNSLSPEPLPIYPVPIGKGGSKSGKKRKKPQKKNRREKWEGI